MTHTPDNSAAIYPGNQTHHRTKHQLVTGKQTEIPILRRAVEYPVAADYGGGHIKVSINQTSEK
ncbi:hypothetical protein [Aeromonas jandaei]|uniref:hypothetical protein n=1 Tax=Aeromonas jandaei TaxID=650 RepID=UPI003BA34063